jgi:Xaa-Pro aminopeptidase
MVSDDVTTIEPNMCLAVEIMLGDPSIGGAMFENAGIVTDDGFEVLNAARETWW